MNLKPALLVLEDGTFYKGHSINNDPLTSIGEVVFNTGMTGYQEIFTDPSYYGQIVIFTYPELGNTGVNEEDYESKNIQLKGAIVKRISNFSSSWRQKNSFINFCLNNNIILLCNIDTRSLTKHLRNFGAMNGGIMWIVKILNKSYIDYKILNKHFKSIII
uniref:carbamoyl-phosphate synthase (glutamine-hydrolyzing) n=1 Tax=Compsopogon caeruleus TaxID=31354 RepID=A0A1Z1XAV5_9RHOD|nr:carbamoyl phosphate synthase small subunit [Compsopogon caeruleus]ARX95985.1 carbamoyl phosphate synthase small subunit [Compsopogon caeruleus]